MNILVTRTAKEVDQINPNLSLDNVNLSSIPSYGYDLAKVIDQQKMWSVRDQLNSASVFKVADYGTDTINNEGKHVFTLTYAVNDISAVPGLTVDNAYDMCISTRQTQAEALGVGDFQGWRQKYFDDQFTTTVVVTTN